MEYFSKFKAVKLRSHIGKYLVAGEDHEKLRQSRKGTTKNATWLVELVVTEGKSHRIRLRSFNGKYLTATDAAFLLGMTGNKVVQSDLDTGLGWKYEWEPIKEGSHVKLRSWCGKYLRGNGGTPPWRNSVTHDDPYTSSTHNWILWSVEALKLLPQNMVSFNESVVSSSSSSYEFDEISGSEPVSSVSVSSRSSLKSRQVSMLLQVRV